MSTAASSMVRVSHSTPALSPSSPLRCRSARCSASWPATSADGSTRCSRAWWTSCSRSPTLLLAITIVGVLGPSLTNTMIAIGIVYTPTFARIARGSTLGVSNLDYIMASRTIGAGSQRIIVRHVLPNIAAPLIVQTTLALSTAILIEATLSFLGLGTQPPMPSWGTMLGTGRRYMELAPWVAIYPGVAIMIAVLGFNLAGDGLRDALDPRLRVA